LKAIDPFHYGEVIYADESAERLSEIFSEASRRTDDRDDRKYSNSLTAGVFRTIMAGSILKIEPAFGSEKGEAKTSPFYFDKRHLFCYLLSKSGYGRGYRHIAPCDHQGDRKAKAIDLQHLT